MKKILGSPHSRSHRPLSHNELDKQPKLRDVITRTHKTRLLVAYINNRKRTFIILWPWTLTFENNLDMIKYVGQRSLSSTVIVRTRTLYLEVGNCYTIWRQNWRYASHFWDGSQVSVWGMWTAWPQSVQCRVVRWIHVCRQSGRAARESGELHQFLPVRVRHRLPVSVSSRPALWRRASHLQLAEQFERRPTTTVCSTVKFYYSVSYQSDRCLKWVFFYFFSSTD